jgi:MinD superfamily P-loop ATPase
MILSFCKKKNMKIVGELPYHTTVTEAMIQEKTIWEYSNGMLSQQITSMWNQVKGILM